MAWCSRTDCDWRQCRKRRHWAASFRIEADWFLLADVHPAIEAFEKLAWRADEAITLGVAPAIPAAVSFIIVGVGSPERRRCDCACYTDRARGNGSSRSHWPAGIANIA